MNEKKQAVLLVHNFYKIPGGEDTVFYNEKELLEKHGHKVIVYTRCNSEMDTMNCIRKILLPLTSIFSVKTYREVRRLIKKNKIDVVHVHNTLSFISPSVYYAALKNHIPVVQTLHNFRLLCPASIFYRVKKNQEGCICEDCIDKSLWCSIKRKCYRDSLISTIISVLILKLHRVLGTYRKINYICLTAFNKDKLLRLNTDKRQHIDIKKIYIKPNFVFPNRSPAFSMREGIVYVGRLDQAKGIYILLKAWKILGNSAPLLKICGSGPQEAGCLSFIKENQLEQVTLCGFMDHDSVIQLISESQALILPSLCYEGFPMTIVEAYSVGTPVIGSNIGNIGALIMDGITGYKFIPASEEDLAAKIHLIQSHHLYESTLKYFTDHYTSEINYRILADIYRQLS